MRNKKSATKKTKNKRDQTEKNERGITGMIRSMRGRAAMDRSRDVNRKGQRSSSRRAA